MKLMLRSALVAVALACGLGGAQADFTSNNAANNGTLTFCGFTVATVNQPCVSIKDSSGNEMFKAANPGAVGLIFGGNPLALGQTTKGLSLPVTLANNPDLFNVAASLTAADSASTTASGQNGVSVISGTATAGSTYAVAVNGQSEADFTVLNTFVGTLQFEGSANNGTTWTPRSAHVMGTKYRTTTITAPGVFHINAAGLTNIRIRDLVLTSGSPSVALNTTGGTGSVYVMNPVELADNTTGLSPTVKAAGTATTSDNALTVFNPSEQAAIGTPADPMYNGSNTATWISLGKALYGQAIPTSVPGTGISGSTPVPGIQFVPNGIAFDVRNLIGGNPVSLSNAFPTQATIGGAAVSATNPDPVQEYVGGSAVASGNPMPTTGVGVTKQHSTALETCHVFTKAATTQGLRSLTATAGTSGAPQSAPLFLFVIEGTTAPTNGASVATNLLDQFFAGSNSTYVQGTVNYGVNPLLTSSGANNFVACLSTTPAPTYTSAGAVGWYTAQVQ